MPPRTSVQPAMFHAPGAGRIGRGERHERRIVGPVDLPGEDRHDADDQHRDDDEQADIFLHVGRAEDAAMLDREGQQHQHRADARRWR